MNLNLEPEIQAALLPAETLEAMDKALRELRRVAGTQLDPDLVQF